MGAGESKGREMTQILYAHMNKQKKNTFPRNGMNIQTPHHKMKCMSFSITALPME
jgi:hypothetical protein